MGLEEQLSSLLQQTGLNAKRQDGAILLYNRDPAFLSKGAAVKDMESALRMTKGYLGYMRTHGFSPIVEWARDHQYRPIPYKEVPNKADPQSAYYVAAMSSVSRINLLRAAQELRARVKTAKLIREVSPITDSDVRRDLKIKKIAAIYRADSEKVS